MFVVITGELKLMEDRMLISGMCSRSLFYIYIFSCLFYRLLQNQVM